MLYEFRSEDRACLAGMETQFDDILREFREKGVNAEAVVVHPCAGDVVADRQAALTRRMREIIRRYSSSEIAENADATDANSATALDIPAVTIGARWAVTRTPTGNGRQVCAAARHEDRAGDGIAIF